MQLRIRMYVICNKVKIHVFINMPYQTGKGILYLISQKIEIKFPLQHEFFSSAKSRLSFLFGIFFVFLDMMHVTLSVGEVSEFSNQKLYFFSLNLFSIPRDIP